MSNDNSSHFIIVSFTKMSIAFSKVINLSPTIDIEFVKSALLISLL